MKAGVGHMTKMASMPMYDKMEANMPIYGKTPFKIFSRTKGLMALGLGKHCGHGPKKVCSNEDRGLTFTFFYGKVKFESLCFYMENIHTFLQEKY